MLLPVRRTVLIGLLVFACGGGCSSGNRGGGPDVHVIARSLSDTTTLATLEDGTVVIDTGVFVHRVEGEGAPALVGDRRAYEAFAPADDGTPAVRSRARSFFGTKDAPMMSEGTEAYAFADGKWNKTKARVGATLAMPYRVRERRRDTSTAVPPAGVRAQPRMFRSTYRRYPDGTFVGLGRERASASIPVGLVIRPRSHEETVVPLPDADERWSCEQAPSADGKAYVDCRAHDALSEERRLYVLDERTWARVTIPSRDLEAPLAVAKDGSIWMGLADPARLVGRSPGGHVTTTILPKAPESLGRASYRAKPLGLNLPRPQMQNVDDLDRIVDLAPTTGGAIIVLAREEGIDGALVVLRAGGSAVDRPEVLGSEIDQLVAMRNAEEPKRWIGHCRAVFVPLAESAGSPAQRDVGDGWFVRGHLRDRKVSGVIFTDDSYDEARFERDVTYFVDTHTTNPASPPDVTCTLPILDFVR